jgi:hypothetical protein
MAKDKDQDTLAEVPAGEPPVTTPPDEGAQHLELPVAEIVESDIGVTQPLTVDVVTQVDPSTGMPEGVDPTEALKANGIVTAEDDQRRIDREVAVAAVYDPSLPITDQPKVVAAMNENEKEA